MTYLVDTSALVRIQRNQSDASWRDEVSSGRVVLCEPVLTEALTIARKDGYSDLEDRLRNEYVWASVPDNIWSMVAAIRRELAAHSADQGLSVADLLVAATAVRLKLTVLHEDGDFETVARFVPEVRQQRVSAEPS